MSIVRVGLAETQGFSEGYEAIFGKKKEEEKKAEKADKAEAEDKEGKGKARKTPDKKK